MKIKKKNLKTSVNQNNLVIKLFPVVIGVQS